MGTLKAVGWAKTVGRRVAAELYARVPGFLDGLRGKVVILTYHRVVSQSELATQCIQPGMYVTADAFATHMQFLKLHFQVVSLEELLRMWSEKTWNHETRYCVITFDDGWLDNYRYALPVLRQHALPATVFLPTAFIGTDRWFWPEKIAWLFRRFSEKEEYVRQRVTEALRSQQSWLADVSVVMLRGDSDRLIESCKVLTTERIDAFVESLASLLDVCLPAQRQVINWSEARSMSATGVSFGSHSVSHRIMTTLPRETMLQEARDSLAVLREQGLKSVPVFCYPNGNWSSEVAECVRAAGYQAATTTEFGCESSTPADVFGLKRVNIHHDITSTDDLFAFHLAGFNNLKMG